MIVMTSVRQVQLQVIHTKRLHTSIFFILVIVDDDDWEGGDNDGDGESNVED